MATWENVGKIQGEKGEKGDKGDRGEQGIQGAKGDKGDSGVAIEGSRYIKFEDGTMITWQTIPLAYISKSFLERTLDFPQPFVAEPFCVVSLAFGNTTPPASALCAPRVHTATNTNVRVQLYRVAGQTDFEEGDSCDVKVVSYGKWK